MSDDDYGNIVVRRGVDNRTPARAGDVVDIYRLLEPFPIAAKAHSGHDQALLDYMSSVESDLGDKAFWREETSIFCPNCPKGKGKKLVSVLIHSPSARRWVSPRPERTISTVDARAAEAWPMHGSPGEAAHVGNVASCPGCRARWLVLSTHEEVTLVAVELARYESRVRE